MKKRFLALLLTLVMVLAIVPQAAFAANGGETKAPQAAAEPAETRAEDGVKAAGNATYLAFTSDVHNGHTGANVSNNRLTEWFSVVLPKYQNNIKVMGFCGDMGGGDTSASTFWTYTQTVMENVTSHGMEGVYAVGNHEYMNGSMASTSNSPEVRNKYSLNKEGRGESGENYVIYCLGTNSSHGSSWAYDDSQVTTLTDYLDSVSNDKVIIILTHFPLHNYGMHRTGNTLPVLNAINAAAKGNDGIYGTADDKKIVFLWGHNHSEGDPNYDHIWAPESTIPDDNKSTVYFYYAAAGSMADSEYGSSASVKGKGLVLTISSDNLLAFRYYDKSGNELKTEDSYYDEIPQEPVDIQGVSITNSNPTVKVGKTLQLKYSTNPSNATVESVSWSSSNDSIASVDKSGKVTGVSEGRATITLTVSDGLSKAVVTANTVVEVTAAGGSEEHTVSITPSTSNPEQSITIDVGDTLIVNVTNGSSNSSYDFAATFSKNGVAEIQGSSTQTIAAGATGQFTFEGVADGTVDITIQNNNSYGSSYTRKGTIHLTVGEGGDTPVDPPTGDTVNITPTTDVPEETIKINVDDTLTINVTNSSSNSAYDFTATLSKSGVAQIVGNTTVNIGQGATGQFTVTGLADGTVDITIQNNNSYGSQYTRKGIIHLIVGEGGDTPVDPPETDTVNITPTTDNPEESAKINVDDILTINVTNGSSSSAYDFTATLSNSGIAQIQGNATQNIAAGATAQFTVKGLAEGTVDITIQNENSYGSQYVRKGIVHLTVGEGGTPVDPPVGEDVTYRLATSLEDGQEYIIASGNSGSVYVISNTSTGSGTSTGLVGISASAANDSITLSASDAAKATFTVEKKTSDSGTVSAWLKQGSNYLYTASSGGLRISSEQTSSGNTGKFWHYKADGKNLLWYFKDGSGNDGYTDNGSTYRYYIKYSTSGTFTYAYVGSGSTLSGTDTPAIYLYEKVTEQIDVESIALTPTSLSMTAGDTESLTVTYDPANATNKTVTWTTGNSSVATVSSSGVVTAVAAGSTVITATCNGKTATCQVTVKAAPTVVYTLTDKLEAGKEYLIANGNSGSVYVVSNEANGSKTLKGIAATVSDGKLTISQSAAANAVFSAVSNSNSSQSGFYLKNGDQYLFADSSDGLRLVAESTQTSSSNNAKSWHYKADDKNLLWFFKDTSSTDGYTDTSSTYKYFLKFSNGDFTDDHASTTSLANTNTQAIYLFVKDDSQTPAGDYTLTVTADKTEVIASDTEPITFTITLSKVEHLGSIQMDIVLPEGLSYVAGSGTIKSNLGYGDYDDDGNGMKFTDETLRISGYDGEHYYTSESDTILATFQCTALSTFTGGNVTLNNLEAYTIPAWEDITEWFSVAPITISVHTHSYGAPSWNWTGYTAATATFTCSAEDDTQTVNATVSSAVGTGENAGYNVYTATATFNGQTYTNTKREAIEYNITYVLNDGALPAGVDNPTPYTVESAAITLPTPTRAGYEFSGWYTAADFSGNAVTSVAAGSTGDKTFYAKWTASAYSISGSIKSWKGNTEEGQVKVELFKGDSEEAFDTATVTNNTSYVFAAVPDGTYTLTVTKKDHTTRDYTVTVNGEAVTLNVEIRLYGDVNGDGKTTTRDVARINSHAQGVDLITDEYYLKVADQVGTDGRVTTRDVSRINSHAQGIDLLW